MRPTRIDPITPTRPPNRGAQACARRTVEHTDRSLGGDLAALSRRPSPTELRIELRTAWKLSDGLGCDERGHGLRKGTVGFTHPPAVVLCSNARIMPGAHRHLRHAVTHLLAVGLPKLAELMKLHLVKPSPMTQPSEILRHGVGLPRLSPIQGVGEHVRIVDQVRLCFSAEGRLTWRCLPVTTSRPADTTSSHTPGERSRIPGANRTFSMSKPWSECWKLVGQMSDFPTIGLPLRIKVPHHPS